MSDLATIAMLTKENGVKVSSVNNNGFIGWTGQVLVKNYNDFAKAEKLIDLGDQENLEKLFEQYYSNNVFAQKPKDMWKADLSVNVLVKDVETMDSNVITLDEFQREISEIIQKDFLHTRNVLNF